MEIITLGAVIILEIIFITSLGIIAFMFFRWQFDQNNAFTRKIGDHTISLHAQVSKLMLSYLPNLNS